MKKQEAINLIKKTLENNFDIDSFQRLVVNIFKDYETASTKVVRSKYIKKAYSPFIDHYVRLVTFRDLNKRVVDAIVVYLKTQSTFKARTRQRNFILDYIKQRHKDGVLVAFVHPNEKDWRFSFVKLESDIERDEKGQIKDVEKITSAKRASFLVGANENSHTAQKQLLPLLESDEQPRFESIAQSFSVEKVTKEFFEKYRELFHRTEESLRKSIEKNLPVEKEFKEKEISTIDFAKKLLGQIVFLYFVQKKGWLGVPRDGKWGEGSKKFLRKLFNEDLISYGNFFNEVLEPLFYEALADDRGKLAYWSKFDCRIPFLNGGLFEPIQGYSWEKTDIELPNDLFSNSRETKESDIGDGILDVFDRFNFTVKEDEPLETEVAIDPEMLGKVFENLLEIKDRKSKGTYYTPREIVHYMCQESLINYLDTELGEKVSQEDISILMKDGASIIEYEEARQNGVKYEDKKKYGKLPEGVTTNAGVIDQKLRDIKICDPAIGSGAFPVGMMNEIVNARNILTTYMPDKEERTPYEFKRHAIANSLYGVDIDPGAVEIAKLRLWLSLIVDEDSMDHIRPLPNLDYKIMQGNSLLEEYEGVKLIDEGYFEDSNQREKEIAGLKEKQSKLQKEFIELHGQGKLSDARKAELDKSMSSINKRLKELTKSDRKVENPNLFGTIDKRREMADKLLDLQKQFFETAGRSDKPRLKEQIEDLGWELIEETLKQEGKEDKIKEVRKFRSSNTKPFFLWKLHFAEVFKENGGFDVVIANPPYVRVDDIPRKEKLTYKRKYTTSTGKYDLYYLFFELAVRIKGENGRITFISPNKFTAATSATNLRKFLLEESKYFKIISTSKLRIFEEASNYPIISIWYSDNPNKESDAIVKEASNVKDLGKYNKADSYSCGMEDFEYFPDKTIPINISQSQFTLVIGLYKGMTTSLGDYLTINEGLRIPKRFEKEGKFSNKYIPIVKQFQFSRYSEVKTGAFIDSKELNDVISNKSERYTNIQKNKILIEEDALAASCTIDTRRRVPQGGVYFATLKKAYEKKDLKLLIGLINSKIFSYIYEVTFAGMHMGGGYLRFRSSFLSSIPIPSLAEEKTEKIISLVRIILNSGVESESPSSRSTRLKKLEEKIDRLIYKLYGLTKEEIEIVEKFYKEKTKK